MSVIWDEKEHVGVAFIIYVQLPHEINKFKFTIIFKLNCYEAASAKFASKNELKSDKVQNIRYFGG